MSDPTVNDIVWCDEEGALAPFVVTGQKGKALQALDTEGRSRSLSVKKIQHVSSRGAGKSADPAAALRVRRARIDEALAGLDLRTVWELVHEDGETMTLEELAELALGEGPDERDATAIALNADRVFFKHRKDGWLPNPARVVEEMERQLAREREEQAALDRMAAAIREPEGAAEADLSEAIKLLEEVAFDGDDAPRYRRARRVLDRLEVGEGRDPRLGPFRELVRIGHFHEDEDLNLRRHRAEASFPPWVEEEAQRLVEQGIDGLRNGRVDLTDLLTISIDDEGTTEIDDALAIEPDGDCWRVHVFIADPAAFVKPGSALDDEARRRGATLYHPVKRFQMLPSSLAEGLASLVAGEERLAMDFAATVDDQGHVIDFEVQTAIVQVDHRLTYDDVDAALADDTEDPGELLELLRGLDEVTLARRQRRIDDGALIFHQHDVNVSVNGDGEIRLKRRDTSLASQRLVSEAMILACSEAAAFCRERDVPAVYRRQAPPDEPLNWDAANASDRVAVMAALRHMKKAELTLTPDRHHSLGVDEYTQVTSPLRRYQDLAMHRQLESAIRDEEAPHWDDELMAIFAEVEETAAIHGNIERDARRYWTMKLLAQQDHPKVEAFVLREIGKRVLVDLVEYGLAVPFSPSRAVDPGDVLELTVQHVNPREDRVVLRD